MTKNEAIWRIIGPGFQRDELDAILKEIGISDESCEFALMQLSPRTPIYEAIEVEVGKQEEICGNLSVQMEAQCKGDPRELVMFCMATLRQCAEVLHTPDILTQAFVRSAVVGVLAVLWVQTWRIRLATVQKVRGFDRLASPFHKDDGDKPAA
jgi:hypothetical protein